MKPKSRKGFLRFVGIGERTPRFYGPAYRDCLNLKLVCAPVPFNLLIALYMNLRYRYMAFCLKKGDAPEELRKLANAPAISAVPETIKVLEIIDGGLWKDTGGRWVCHFTDAEVTQVRQALAKAKAKGDGDE
jgi:hypothetical protein